MHLPKYEFNIHSSAILMRHMSSKTLSSADSDRHDGGTLVTRWFQITGYVSEMVVREMLGEVDG